MTTLREIKSEMYVFMYASTKRRAGEGYTRKVLCFFLLVEPEGPWCLQRNTGALLFLDRVNGLLRQDRCLQQVRRKRSTLLRFAFCRGHVRNDDAAGSSAVTSKSCDRRRADAAVTVDVVTSCVTSRRRSPLQVLQLILIRESSFDDLRHEREVNSEPNYLYRMYRIIIENDR